MNDKLAQMEAEQMAMQLKGQQAEIEEEDVKGKFSGSESDSDFDELDGEEEKIMRAMREQRLQ